MTNCDAIEAAARDLPDGWGILIAVERGSGIVDLFDAEGNSTEFASNRESLSEEIADAVQHAIAAEKANVR